METQVMEMPMNQEAKEQTTIAEKSLQIAQDFHIVTQSDFEIAGDNLKRDKIIRKRIVEIRLGMTRPLDKSKTTIMDFFREPVDNLDKSESIYKNKRSEYRREEERQRLREEARLQALARKEEERQRRLKQAQIDRAIASGKDEKVERLEEEKEEIFVPAPIVQKTVPKTKGFAVIQNWKFEIVDAPKVPPEYLMPDKEKIGRVIRGAQGTLLIEGIRIYCEESESVRT